MEEVGNDVAVLEIVVVMRAIHIGGDDRHKVASVISSVQSIGVRAVVWVMLKCTCW